MVNKTVGEVQRYSSQALVQHFVRRLEGPQWAIVGGFVDLDVSSVAPSGWV